MNTDQLNSTHQLQFGPFSLGGEPVCLRRDSDPINLRPMSLQVLRYLSERPGQFVSKDELLDRIWTGRVVSDSGLRLCVGEIRAALGDDAKSPQYLETIVGKGYCFLEGAGGKALYPDTTGPIVGRDADLRRLDDSYRLAIAGRTQFVLLGGEPGIGKTTLVDSFLDLTSRDHGADVIQGQCIIHYGKQEAYGPMIEAIATFWGDKNDTGLSKEFERHAPSWLLQIPEILDAMLFERVKRRAEGMATGRMVREFCQLVATLVEKKPLVIVIEDLHWADVSTIDLLAALAEHDNLPLMILGTYRPADAVLYSQSLRNTVKELKGRGLCKELLLELLTEADLKNYLAGRLNGEVSDDLAKRLYRRIEGNPLFMVKLVEELIRTQSLVCHDGLWCVGNQAGILETDIPESLQSLISRYLEALPQAHREMLEVASVVGMEFSAAAMTDVLAKKVEEIETTCENLSTASQFIEAGKLLTWPDGTLTGSYRFQHHLYLEVIYSQIAEARRARIHLKIGKRLEAGYGKRASEIAPSLASHFKLGHDLDRAIGYRKLSAEQALGRHAYSIAIDELRAALNKLGQMPETTERNRQQLDCLILLGSALIAVQGYTSPEVEQTFSHALEICDSLPDSELKFRALWNFAGFHMARGELARSRPLIEQAVELVKESANPDLALLAEDALAQQFFFEGDFKNASERSARVLDLYDSARHGKLAKAYSQEDPAQVCAGIDVIASWLLGFQDQSLARERLVRELSAQLNNPHSTAFGLVLCAIASQFRRDSLATQEYADELIELADRHELHWMSIAMALKGWAMAKQKPGVEHLEMIENGLTTWRQAGVRAFIPFCLGLLAETHRELGQIPQARTAVTEALSILAQTRESWYESELHRLQGELILQSGADQQDAEQSFVKSLEIARNCQALLLELYAAVSLSQLWIEQDRSLEVPELLQPIIARFNEDLDNSSLKRAHELVAISC